MSESQSFQLSYSARKSIKEIRRSTTTASGLYRRVQIVDLLDQGFSPTEIATKLNVTRRTVYKWRDRYLVDGIKGLTDRARPGRPSKITDKTVQKVLSLSTEYLPEESTHWSVRLMAAHAGISEWQVRQIWNAFDIKPHLTKTFKISNDPNFAEKVIDVVGLYMNPPSNAVVLSVDEKTQIQALDRTQPGLPLGPGKIGSYTHDYKRHGTTALYAAFNVANGKVIASVKNRTRSKEFLSFLKLVNRRIPKDKHLHIVLDNHSAHKTKDVREWLKENPRVHFHFTPTSASWMNAVEGWFSQLERRALYRGVFTSVYDLKNQLIEFVKIHNEKLSKPFIWTKPAKQIIDSVNRAKKVLPN